MQFIMEKISGRIWVLLMGIVVAIAIVISAIVMDRKVIQSQAAEPAPKKNKVSTLPAILIKSASTLVEGPLKREK